ALGRPVGQQVRKLSREIVRAQRVGRSAERERRRRVRARRASDAEIDSARIKRLEHLERLGHLERRVVRQHHPARSNADAGRLLPAALGLISKEAISSSPSSGLSVTFVLRLREGGGSCAKLQGIPDMVYNRRYETPICLSDVSNRLNLAEAARC